MTTATTGRQDWRFDVQLISHQALAVYMEHRDFSVRSLADRTGIHRSTIGHLRSGRRRNINKDDAKKIARALDCPVEALFVARLSHVSQDTTSRRAS